jgi:hypothetical protein
MNPQVAEAVGHALAANLQEAGMDPEQADELALATIQDVMMQTGVSQDPNADPNAQPVSDAPPDQAPVGA